MVIGVGGIGSKKCVVARLIRDAAFLPPLLPIPSSTFRALYSMMEHRDATRANSATSRKIDGKGSRKRERKRERGWLRECVKEKMTSLTGQRSTRCGTEGQQRERRGSNEPLPS